MPHERSRYLSTALRTTLTWSKTVSLLGMRQVGKTTLIRQLVDRYVTLDDDQLLRRLEQGNWADIETPAAPLAVDECQKFGPLFDRIKLIVDQRKKPGQYILTGSVRFLSKKGIRESLTGRTVALELLPMTLSESHRRPASGFLRSAIEEETRALLAEAGKRSRFKRSDVMKFAETGGLPGICFKRSPAIRRDLLNAHLETLLSRDLRFLYSTRIPYPRLKALFGELARHQGERTNLASLARKINTSIPTLQAVFAAFEGLFLIRPVGDTYYVEDQGLASVAIPGVGESELHRLRRVVFQELWSQLSYQFRGEFTLENYRTRGGIEVPFLIRFNAGPILAICVDETEGASDKTQKSLTWLRKREPRAKGLVFHNGSAAYVSPGGHLALPFHTIY
ncbi:MAG: AAA family ATPase [Oligoflexia bacterium]|nr:AAA family ATPase [Oligoflexia bacterium]